MLAQWFMSVLLSMSRPPHFLYALTNSDFSQVANTQAFAVAYLQATSNGIQNRCREVHQQCLRLAMDVR